MISIAKQCQITGHDRHDLTNALRNGLGHPKFRPRKEGKRGPVLSPDQALNLGVIVSFMRAGCDGALINSWVTPAFIEAVKTGKVKHVFVWPRGSHAWKVDDLNADSRFRIGGMFDPCLFFTECVTTGTDCRYVPVGAVRMKLLEACYPGTLMQIASGWVGERASPVTGLADRLQSHANGFGHGV